MTDVYANGREVSGKATPNKTIAAFPDVCLSPPSPPAGPIPIPYPNFGMASDTTDGCTTVFVKGKEAGKKNASKYAKITGDEAATNSFGAGVVSHKINGPLYFQAYSFDVLFEGGGAERFLDITTTNHMNGQNTNAPMVSAAKPAPPGGPTEADCKALAKKNEDFRAAVPKGKKRNINRNHTVSNGFVFDEAGKAAIRPGTSASTQLAGLMKPDIVPPVDTTKGGGKVVKRRIQRKGERKSRQRVVMDFCGGKCEHPTGGLQAHAELNQLNAVARHFNGNTAGKTVLLSINWRSRGRQKPPEPCSNCKTALQCICDNKCMTILICDKDNKPVDRCKEPYEDDL